MELGEKLRQARLEAGLSQRQLCGEKITRNMLSQIENGTARPSMDTLGFLARRLGKPIGYFLEDGSGASVNMGVITAARKAWDAGDYAAVVAALEGYREPDEVFDRERELLSVQAYLALAEQALQGGRKPYARELLEKAAAEPAYCAPELRRRRLLLLGRLEPVSGLLPSLDEELILRAGEALEAGLRSRAAKLLEAAEDQDDPRWNLTRGEVYLAEGAYAAAARAFHRAEDAFPRLTAPRLEVCYRELEDFKQAYHYAKLAEKG